MNKFNKDLSFEEQMKLIKAKVGEEKEYLRNLSFDPTPIIEVVKKFIDRWDPVQLLAMECPEDEYEAEIRRISIYITKHLDDLNIIKLEQQIREVFEETFEEEIVQDKSSIDTATGIYTALIGLHKSPSGPLEQYRQRQTNALFSSHCPPLFLLGLSNTYFLEATE